MKWLDRMEELLIASLMAGATALIFISVLHRYASGFEVLQSITQAIHLGWAQELCIIAFVWMAKFGAAYGVRTGIHVGVDVIIRRLPNHQQAYMVTVGLLAGALFTGIISWLGAHFVWHNGAEHFFCHLFDLPTESYEGPITPDLEWPTWIVYSAIPLGSGLMCFRFCQVCWQFHRTGFLPKHDHSHVDGLDQTT